MYVCLCNGVTDHQIKRAIDSGAADVKAIRSQLGVACQCCKCLPEVRALLSEHHSPSDHVFSVNFFLLSHILSAKIIDLPL